MGEVAIVGMDCAAGDSGNLESWAKALYAGGGMAASELESGHGVRAGEIICTAYRVGRSVGLPVDARQEHRYGERRQVFASEVLAEALEAAVAWLGDGTADRVELRGEDAYGSAQVVLARLDDAEPANGFAVVDNVARGAEQDGAEVCRGSLGAAGVFPGAIGYLDVGTWPPSPAVLEAYATSSDRLTSAVGAVVAQHAGPPLCPLWGLLRATLSLHRRVLYPTPGMGAEDDVSTAGWDGTPLYLVPEARPWFLGQGQVKRYAAIYHTANGRAGHVVLSEPARMRAGAVGRAGNRTTAVRAGLASEPRLLLPISGESTGEILSRVDLIHRRLVSGVAAIEVATEAQAASANEPGAPLALALVGRTAEDLLKEISFAKEGALSGDVHRASGPEWQTPGGSCFTSAPLGPGGVTFVYPGAFNSYVGLGRDLFQHFPDLHERLAPWVSDLERATAAQHIYPRSRSRLTDASMAERQASLNADASALIESGTIFAVAHTLIVRDIFGVAPAAAMGYSLGETSMLWAAGVWQDGDHGAYAMRASPLFHDRIVGPKAAVREHWGLDARSDVAWTTFLLKLRADGASGMQVLQRALEREPRVYLTLINQLGEVVIAGDEAGCQRVIAALDCHALAVPYGVVIHTEAVASELGAFAELYQHPVVHQPDIRFYSAADYGQLALESGILADAMARMTCQPVDFPRLVHRVYEDGARIFVELGPLGTCTRRIQRILRSQPHSAVAINPRPGGDIDGVLGVLARLIAHRVPVDLAPLAEGRTGRWAAGQISESENLESQHEGLESVIQNRESGFQYPVSSINEMVYERYLLPHNRDVAATHRAFLEARHAAQVRASEVIGMQVAVGRGVVGALTGRGAASPPAPALAVVESGSASRPIGRPPGTERVGWGAESDRGSVSPPDPRATAWVDGSVSRASRREVVYDEMALREFAAGNAERCFGPDFAVYRGRRLPRIPNGDLLLLSRVVEVADDDRVLVSEYDVPEDAWFYREGEYPALPPYAILMEMGLQPCGILSAHRRTCLLQPEANLYFRNLDGVGEILPAPNLRGRTVQNEVRLLSSAQAQGAIVQRYAFGLSCGGERVYHGEATFGYFRREALGRQGVEAGGEGSQVWPAGREPKAVTRRLGSREGDVWIAPRRLQLLNEIVMVPDGGEHGLGYLGATGRLSPSDWFFSAHFHEDPVMPGSLGVEAALQAMATYGRARYPRFEEASVSYPAESRVGWRYRGQLTPEDRDWSLEVHLSDVVETPDGMGIKLVGDAGVWRRASGAAVDSGERIYTINDLALCLTRPTPRQASVEGGMR
jgi:PfaB family protein